MTPTPLRTSGHQRSAVLAAVSIACTVLFLAALPASALAAYACKQSTPDTPTAVRVFMLVRDAHCVDWAAGGHINNTVWISTNNSTNFSSWVEVGYTKGDSFGNDILTWYWGDKRPGSNFYAHPLYSAPISVGTSYWVELDDGANFSNTWTGTIAGTKYIKSYPNPPDRAYGIMQVGIESTNLNSTMGSSSSPVKNWYLDYQLDYMWRGVWPDPFIDNINGHGHCSWYSYGRDLYCWMS